MLGSAAVPPQQHLVARAINPAAALPQVNYNLLAVNVFMATTGVYQLYRKAT